MDRPSLTFLTTGITLGSFGFALISGFFFSLPPVANLSYADFSWPSLPFSPGFTPFVVVVVVAIAVVVVVVDNC